MSVKVVNNTAKLKECISAGRLVYALSSEIMDDCNRYCKEQTGTLRNSVYSLSDKTNGILCWYATKDGNPYALYAYYAGTPNTEYNPDARLQWCEYAKSVHSGEWHTTLQNLIKKELENL